MHSIVVTFLSTSTVVAALDMTTGHVSIPTNTCARTQPRAFFLPPGGAS
jgi:hypothetical protein